MNPQISERRQCYQCDEHLLENWPSDYCANCRPVRAPQSQPEVQQGEKPTEEKILSEFARIIYERETLAQTVGEMLATLTINRARKTIRCDDEEYFTKLIEGWKTAVNSIRKSDQPSLKSQLESLVGELEKISESDSLDPKNTDLITRAANRLRELLKNV